MKAAEDAVPVDAMDVDFDDDDVRFVTVGGTSGHEAALVVRRPAGTTLIVNYIIAHMPEAAGPVLRFMRFAGDAPHVPLPVALTLKDTQGLGAQLLTWAELPGLKRIIVSHEEPIEADVRARVIELAASLA